MRLIINETVNHALGAERDHILAGRRPIRQHNEMAAKTGTHLFISTKTKRKRLSQPTTAQLRHTPLNEVNQQ